MARLNEPPQPAAESLDALKRRFVRQNREIARANTTQSVRIRNLECEVSQLLGENMSLREEIIRLQNEVERNTKRYVLEGVDNVRGKLEAKLSELENLVRELGDVHKTTDIKRAQKRRSINRSSPKRSPDQRVWKNTLTLSEAVGGADGRLPPIVEGKYYPRKTMDAEELLGTMADPASITDSPELGPPPVAHFEQGDPIKFDSPQDGSSKEASPADTEEAHPKLLANLETRKKRRESSHRRDGDISKSVTESIKKTSTREGTGIDQLKSGAKRKFNIREEEENPEPTRDRDESEVQFIRENAESRKSDRGYSTSTVNSTAKAVSSKSSSAPSLTTREGRDKPIDAPTANIMTTRKALGPKSVNSDPLNPPLKHQRTNSKDKVLDAKDDLAKIIREKNRLRDKSQPKTAKQSDKSEVAKGTAAAATVPKSVDPPPETPIPAPNELFSPIPSEPSASRPDSRDTPPPPELGPDTGTGSFGRASRRPKGTVNYAQPNLRDKMRRPTAELVDAVAAEERARQANLAAKADKEASDAALIKLEDDTDAIPIWKANKPMESNGAVVEDPPSPLCNKIGQSSNDLPPSVITERRRRTIVPFRNDDETKPSTTSSSGAASAIVALTANSHRAKRNEDERLETSLRGNDEKHEYDLAERPSIYDFTGSSPNNGLHSEEGENKTREEEAPKPARSSRRYSTVVPATSDQSKGTLSISRRGASGGSRRESILGGGRRGEGAGTGMARTKSVLELRGGEGGGEEEAAVGDRGRGERAAGRRRSMML